MADTSHSLLDRLQRDPRSEAWDQFVGLYAPLLVDWAARYGVQASDADDLAQDVLMVVLRELPEFQQRHPGSFRNWLRKILVNRLRDFWRSRQYRPIATGETEFLSRLNELEDDASHASQVWNRQHDEFVVRQLMDAVRGQFEPKTWLAFRRQVVDGVRADAVAAELGLSLSSAYVAKSRVLSALRREAESWIEPS